MRNLFLITLVSGLSACNALAPVERPLNSCSLTDSAKQSGGVLPNDVKEFNQCSYSCPNGQTKTNTQFGACAIFISQ
jgi:uncharacterized lipoprotein